MIGLSQGGYCLCGYDYLKKSTKGGDDTLVTFLRIMHMSNRILYSLTTNESKRNDTNYTCVCIISRMMIRNSISDIEVYTEDEATELCNIPCCKGSCVDGIFQVYYVHCSCITQMHEKDNIVLGLH